MKGIIKITELLHVIYLESGILHDIISIGIPTQEWRQKAIKEAEKLFINYMHKMDSQLGSNPEKNEIIKDAFEKGYFEAFDKDIFLRWNRVEIVKKKDKHHP